MEINVINNDNDNNNNENTINNKETTMENTINNNNETLDIFARLKEKGIEITAEQLDIIKEELKKEGHVDRGPSLLQTAIDWLKAQCDKDGDEGAAARVVGFNCGAICAALEKEGLYHSGGKTPQNTLATAFLREINEGKGRVKKTNFKGFYTYNPVVDTAAN